MKRLVSVSTYEYNETYDSGARNGNSRSIPPCSVGSCTFHPFKYLKKSLGFHYKSFYLIHLLSITFICD